MFTLHPIRQISTSQNGQTLVEILMVLTILIIVIFGLIISVNFALQTVGVSKNRSLATHYATEGIEWARAQKEAGWNNLPTGGSPMPAPGTGPIAQTPFTRQVSLAGPNCSGVFTAADEEACVLVDVFWYEGSQFYNVHLYTLLTNWQ